MANIRARKITSAQQQRILLKFEAEHNEDIQQSFFSYISSFLVSLCIRVYLSAYIYYIYTHFTMLSGVAKELVVFASCSSIILHAILLCASFHLLFRTFCFVSIRYVSFRSFFDANFRLRKLFRRKCNNKTESKYFNCVLLSILKHAQQTK